MKVSSTTAGSSLRIDLEALSGNCRLLVEQVAPAQVAAVAYADTISYESLTRLGHRSARDYLPVPLEAAAPRPACA